MTPAGYQIEARLGAGGFGEVYQALAPSGERVAIKCLRDIEPQALARFERERRLLGLLGREQGFVGLLDAGSTDAGPYIVMDFMPGGTLRDRLRSGAALTVDEVLELGLTLAAAMGRAHERGVIHRDLKPENILFDAHGEAHIGDLGLGKIRSSAGQAGGRVSLTGQDDIVGTVAYMAPEQMQASRDVDLRADVFALGVILYECLAGRPPYSGGNSVEIVFKASRGEYPPLTDKRPETPPALAELIDDCLAASPDDRPANGHELLARLETLDEGDDGGPMLAAAIVAMSCVLLAVLAVVLVRGGPMTGPSTAGPVIAKPAGSDPSNDPANDPAGKSSESSPEDPEASPTGFRLPDPTPTAAPPEARTTRQRWRSHFARAPLRVERIIGGESGRELTMIAALGRHPRDGRIVTGTMAGWIRVWSPRDGRCLSAIWSGFRDGIHDLAWSSDGGVLVASSHGEGGLVFLRAEDGQELARVDDGERRAALYPLPDGLLLAVASTGLSIWRCADGRRLKAFRDERLEGLRCAVAIEDSTWLVSAAGGRLLEVRIDTGEVLQERDSDEAACYALRRLDGDRAIGTTALGRLIVINLESLLVTRSLGAVDQSDMTAAPSHRVLRDAAVRVDGSEIFTVGDDARVRRWSTDDFQELEPLGLRAAGGWFHRILFADRETLLVAGNGGRLRAYDLTGGRELWEPRGPDGEVQKLGISAPRGADEAGRLIILSDRGGLRSLDARTGAFVGLQSNVGSPLELSCGDRNGLGAALFLKDGPGDKTAVVIWQADRLKARAAVISFPELGVDLAWRDESTVLMLDARGNLHFSHAAVSKEETTPTRTVDTGVRFPVGLLINTDSAGRPESLEVIAADSSSVLLSPEGRLLERRPPWLKGRIFKVVRCAGRTFAAGELGKGRSRQTVLYAREPEPRALWRGHGRLVDLVASRSRVAAVVAGQGLIVAEARGPGPLVRLPLPEGHHVAAAAARPDDERILVGTARGLIFTLAPRGSD